MKYYTENKYIYKYNIAGKHCVFTLYSKILSEATFKYKVKTKELKYFIYFYKGNNFHNSKGPATYSYIDIIDIFNDTEYLVDRTVEKTYIYNSKRYEKRFNSNKDWRQYTRLLPFK